MIIGDKASFAVEYEISSDNPQMGFGRIWIENDFIGTFEDVIYLNGYLLGILYSIKAAEELKDDLKDLSKEDLYKLLTSREYDYSDSYRVRRSTFTDDFSIWRYKKDNTILVLWKVLRNDYFKDLANYTKDILLKAISIETFETVLLELEESYRKHGINTK